MKTQCQILGNTCIMIKEAYHGWPRVPWHGGTCVTWVHECHTDNGSLNQHSWLSRWNWWDKWVSMISTPPFFPLHKQKKYCDHGTLITGIICLINNDNTVCPVKAKRSVDIKLIILECLLITRTLYLITFSYLVIEKKSIGNINFFFFIFWCINNIN